MRPLRDFNFATDCLLAEGVWKARGLVLPQPEACVSYDMVLCRCVYVLTKHTKITRAPSFPLFLPLPLHRGAHRDGGHGTSYSEKYYDGDRPAAMHNKNVEWLRYAHFWWLYLGFVAFFVTLLRLTVLSKAEDLGMVLTVTHVVHNLVS